MLLKTFLDYYYYYYYYFLWIALKRVKKIVSLDAESDSHLINMSSRKKILAMGAF